LGDFVSDNGHKKNQIFKFFLANLRHYDEAVRNFVVKRIQSWAQTTQISACMHAEDILFHQRSYFIILKFLFSNKNQFIFRSFI